MRVKLELASSGSTGIRQGIPQCQAPVFPSAALLVLDTRTLLDDARITEQCAALCDAVDDPSVAQKLTRLIAYGISVQLI
ncbi:MAG: hypothetical protein H7274_13845 [Rhodoferax sp.]|nr:hypothetical protein [Rhodoferax sp.]